MVVKHQRKGRSDKGKSGREAKKGASGIAAAYITRTKAVKRLQISLKDFRRLCILKGIYPRDPKRKREGRDKTYYHIKDIAYLQHEPLLRHFRQLKVFLRRVHRAKVINDRFRLQQLEQNRPVLTLHHLLRERYPAFHLAINDCDDALNLLCLFRLLPTSTLVRAFTAEYAEAIAQVVNHFLLYVIHTHSLTKAFISIKGIYYQASVKGQPVTFLMPHQFTQHLPSDVDYRVMFTFVQLYVVLMRFVLYKLYHDEELVYPPSVDVAGMERGKMLTAAVVERIKRKQDEQTEVKVVEGKEERRLDPDGEDEEKREQDNSSTKRKSTADPQLQKQINSVVKALTANTEEEQEEDAMMAGEADAKEDDDAVFASSDPPTAAQVDYDKRRLIFSACTFLLSREVPRLSLELLVLSGGGRVVHETDLLLSSSSSSSVPAITHHVIDRPKLKLQRKPDVHYIQPQWVFDSFNLRVLVPVSLYGVGVICPPHLSPFVEDEAEGSGGYEPMQRKVQRGWVEGVKDAAEVLRERGVLVQHGGMEGEDEEDEEERYEKEMERERSGVQFEQDEAANEEKEEKQHEDGEQNSEEEEEEEEDTEAEPEEEEEERRQAEELKEEVKPKQRRTHPDDDAQATDLAKIMMGKKQARLYQRMQFGLARKAAAADTLKRKRDEAEMKERRKGRDEQPAKGRKVGRDGEGTGEKRGVQAKPELNRLRVKRSKLL